MALFNKYGEHNVEEEATRRQKLIETFLDSDETHLLMLNEKQQTPTVKIEKTTGGGSSYSAVCPNCGKLKILSSELNSMRAVCKQCYCTFNLEK